MKEKKKRKPNGYWTYDKCKEVALLCETKTELLKKHKSAYRHINKNEWFELINHFIEKKKPNGYWTYDKCKEEIKKYDIPHKSTIYYIIKNNGWDELIPKTEKYSKDYCESVALKYKYFCDFRKNDKNIVVYAKYHNFYDEITSHLKIKVKWSFEKCKEISLKYNTIYDFRKNNRLAYRYSVKNKWLSDITHHMIYHISEKGYWTKEKCHEIALEYSNYFDFLKNEKKIVNYSKEMKFHREITSHMKKKKKPNYWTIEKCVDAVSKCNTLDELNDKFPGAMNRLYKENKSFIMEDLFKQKQKNYWTKEKCHETALRYESRSDFKLNENSAYIKSRKSGWLDFVCSHMKLKHIPSSYWTKENCGIEALKYATKKEFSSKSRGAYTKTRVSGWLDELCGHMILKNDTKRCIYSFEFSDNSVYVGLTNHFKRRKYEHLYRDDKKSTVYDYIKKTNLKPKITQITGYVNVKKAKKLESFYVKLYKLLDWNILNVTKTGGIGSNIKIWTTENITKESLKYKSRGEFALKSASAYNAAFREKILEKLFPIRYFKSDS